MVDTRMGNRVDTLEKEVNNLRELWQKDHDERNKQFWILDGKLSRIPTFEEILAAMNGKLAIEGEQTIANLDHNYNSEFHYHQQHNLPTTTKFLINLGLNKATTSTTKSTSPPIYPTTKFPINSTHKVATKPSIKPTHQHFNFTLTTINSTLQPHIKVAQPSSYQLRTQWP